jgi:hypothetical protein
VAEEQEPIPETVSVLLESAQQLYEDERSHGEALDARLGQLTAFSGLLLTLIAPLGANQLDKGHGSGFDLTYMVSIILFAATALLAVSGGFRTRTVDIQGEKFKMTGWRRTAIKEAVLKEYSGAMTLTPTVEAKRQIVADLVASYSDVKELNGLKFSLVRQVSLGLCAGLLAVAAQALILVL